MPSKLSVPGMPTPASIDDGFKVGVTEAAEFGAVVGYSFFLNESRDFPFEYSLFVTGFGR